ncbi:Metallo-dependent phosphatase-like protein [Sporodiniella umbellata]|nr:Metallo-dependent phosphatase-like protein [Sporodiniella umbellata]
MTLFVSSAVGLPRIGNGSPGLVCHPDAYNSLGHDWNRTYSATEPQQVHTSLLEDSKAIRVQFATLSPISQSVLAYWPKSDGLDSSKKTLVTGEDSIFVDGGLFRRKLYLHNIKTDTLKPDTKFYYQVGSKQDGNTQWSNTYEFRSASLKKDFSFIATGDIGACNAVSAFHMMEYGKTGKYDFVTVAGDQGYDLSDFGGTKGDQYMNFMQDLFANVPYLGSAGNHEFWYNFSHYKNRFDIVPYRESKSENSLMYSINYKSLHLISFSTEVYFTGNKDEIQTGLNWLEADLIEANKHRDERPWIIFLTHHPIYCSTPSLDCSLKAKRVREGPGLFHRSGGLEEVLLRHKVDLYMSGHVHNYERTYPVANGKVTSKSYDNPPSMFQLVIGNGGQPEGADKFDEKKVPDFSALRYSGYGFSTFRITPTTMEIVHRKTLESGAMGDIVDSITITKNGSASANSTEASKSHPTEANKSSTSEVPKKSSGQEKS